MFSGMGDDSQWLKSHGLWHLMRDDDPSALCGLKPSPNKRWVTSHYVLRTSNLDPNSICGECDELASPIAGGESATQLMKRRMTWEAWKAKENAERKGLRDASVNDRPDPSNSVHTVSGGLPGLGKRK